VAIVHCRSAFTRTIRSSCSFLFFFFSSRRRHTRWPRDWSSDVCSSDLPASFAGQSFHTAPPPVRKDWPAKLAGCVVEKRHTVLRSEERRVGKECRSRWWWRYNKRKTG